MLHTVVQVAPYERPALSKAYLFPECKSFIMSKICKKKVKYLILSVLWILHCNLTSLFLQLLLDFQDFTSVLEVEERDFYQIGTKKKVMVAMTFC